MAPLPCPVCGKRFEPRQTSAMPFCSDRCRQVDLARWLDEKYQVPGPSPHEPEEPQGGSPGSGGPA